ncbi:hypothetical protein A3D78_04785 [Candidatus Gottesmanbacteria bacterium RIFCSPHIGHO2_02_FULL_39_14]|uniref:Major facilitator superfamily (MFS) profile domain-containing protein n=1 Tax=Candidatus Gottesmanbacteria bacterium RIFCSPHIGHO2_02_FULL_39_14 TaxID=1798383 RepID=A0A1F5ZTH7_9BACT|nr:MAG: hypothetical protein A3D78_04785 [Candidatus Gottesmanbacteria bacterium RIFCSPHIGHO2_02_FULL_39_14]
MLWLGQIISQISLNILSFVLAIEVYQLTMSNTAVSLMLLTFGLPAIIFGVMFGGIVDHFDKRSVLIFCNLSRAFILFFYFLFSAHIFMLYLLSVLISIFTQLFIPAEAPSIPQLVKKDDLLSANSLFTITFYLSTVIGSLTAGPLLRVFGSQNIFIIMTIFMLLASFFNYRLPRLSASKKVKFEFYIINFVKPVYEGFLFIHQHERIRQSLYLLTFSQALMATLVVLAPGFADKILLIDLKDISLVVMGPAAVGLILGAFLVGVKPNNILRGTIILSGIIISGITLIMLAVISFFNLHGMIYAMMFLLLVLGVANSFINVPSSTILQEETDENLRGRIYGVLTSLIGGFSLLPVLFSGILADVVGVGRTLFIIGIMVFLIGSYFGQKRIRIIY